MWELMTTVGAGLALTFIVCVTVAVMALMGLYLASAVMLLERFARTANRLPTLLTAALACGGGGAAYLVYARPSGLLGMLGPAAMASPWLALLGTLTTAIVVTAACRWLLLHTDEVRRGTVLLVLLSLGGAAWLGSTAEPKVALGPAIALFAIALGIRVADRRMGASGPNQQNQERTRLSQVEGQLYCVAGALLLGGGVALWLDAPWPALARVGGDLFAVIVAALWLGLIPLAAAGLAEARGSVEWFIAIRYLVAKRRQVFISAITSICVGGIAAGVWLIIIVLSVMNGFERTWREEILGNHPHLTIHADEGGLADYERLVERVREVPGITGASAYLEADAMVRGAGGEIFGVKVRGIDARSIGEVTDLPSDLVIGSLDALASGELGDSGVPAVVIGNELAISVGVGVGDPLMLISPFGGPKTPLGPAPRLERFRVAGIYRSSFFQYGEVYTYVSIPAAQAFRSSADVVDGIEARTDDFRRSIAIGEEVEAILGSGYVTRDWKEFFPAFFQALRTERMMMSVLLLMILVVAAFLIVATLVMMIMEKSSDIAILKAMGAGDDTIERIFAIEGTLIGLGGTLIGMIAGVAVTHQLGWIQDRIESFTGIDSLPSSIYQFSTLPSEVDPTQVAFATVVAMVLSLGATLLPSRQGAGLDPAEGLRYE